MRSCTLLIALLIGSPIGAAEPAPAPAKDHWAFQPIRPTAPPHVKKFVDWIRTPVDAFLAARYESDHIEPNREADRRTLLRRLALDLTGLPPTPEDVDAFLADASPAAYQNQVERLLASPHYGERWARHWLDLARWAESEGYESNHPRPYAWRYRDWVVRAFQDDKPFADFVREQIAGDEITPLTDDNLIATGFLAAARLSSNEEDRPRQRNDFLVDIVNTTAGTFLGLTYQCAQCHNHKFDAITLRDYYRLQAFFVRGQPGNLKLQSPELWTAYNAKKPAGYDDAAREKNALFDLARDRKHADVRSKLPKESLEALALPREERTPEQENLARKADLLFQVTLAGYEKMLRPDEKKRYDELLNQIAEMEKGMLDVPQTFGFYSASSRHTVDVLPMLGFYPLHFDRDFLLKNRAYVLSSGDVHRPGVALDPGVPAILGEKRFESRLSLADWLTSKDNSLVARVYVNRLWQHHFGRGLVGSSSDFGVKGDLPTHPELLDWLAGELLRTGSTKHLHRLIVGSAAYRLDSKVHPANQARDPDNRTWWRWQPRRLEAEAIRDSLLAVSGELDRHIGGPGAKESTRRSLYLTQRREAPPPHQALFDGPNQMTESCGKRLVTTVPLQALYLLNNASSLARAQALARRAADSPRPVEAAYRLALQRSPTSAEQALAERFLRSDVFASGDDGLVHLCQVLMNLNEFVYLE